MIAQDIISAALYINRHMETARIVPFAGGQIGIFTRRCPGGNSANEDACGLIELQGDTGIAALADGMGGAAYGGESAEIAVRTVVSETELAAEKELPLRAGIVNAFEQAQEEILQLPGSGGTTLIVLEIGENLVRPYQVGDSSTLVVGGKGKVKYHNIPHSPTGFGVEAGYMDEAEAVRHEDRHLISNVLGTAGMYIEIGPKVPLAARDTVLVASDGLADNLYPAEIIECCCLRPMEKALESLAEQATDRMLHPVPGFPSKPDDLTILLYRPS